MRYTSDPTRREAGAKAKGHAVAYGPLKKFLEKYITLGMIVLLPTHGASRRSRTLLPPILRGECVQ